MRQFGWLTVFLTACSGGEEADILGLGDSIMEWNIEEEQSIPEVAAAAMGQSVDNRAVGGSYLTAEEGDDIRDQWEAGDWSWVILSGGGNDMNDECDCGDCDENIDGLISADGSSGDLVDFAEEILASGAKLALMSYYPMPEDAAFGFDRCNEEVEITRERYQALADRHDDMILVDAALVVDPESTPEAYDEDLVHPSIEGSVLIGTYFAEQMSSLGAP